MSKKIVSKETDIYEHQIRKFGINRLVSIKASKPMSGLGSNLIKYQFNGRFQDDSKIWLTCVLALVAVDTGNFGIGALLTNSEGTIIAYGHNEVFNPYFRSDRHAEMVVLTRFEDEHHRTRRVGSYALYTSLEPCPMCLTRLITSGVGTIKYAAVDPTGGMVHIISNLPDIWLELSAKRTFASADCSPRLSEMATAIFLLNADELNRKLERRCI